ncbi:MAG TPA: dihydrolipoyl dehydrogenase [Xanthomonadales bacterium]|nr:dihydrolipoyl dehydrogenase [Xanthomonadales bacterium]
MSDSIEVRVPDIGDFDKVPVIEVLVKAGDSVEKEQSLITLESDKATMEVPSPADGVIDSMNVSLDDEVSEGDLILTLTAAESAPAEPEKEPGKEEAAPSTEKKDNSESAASSQSEPQDSAQVEEEHDYDFDVVVLGSGPGGYTAAFRAADLGLKTAIVERYSSLGGVCLNVGCIPSKALLHTAQIIDEAAAMAQHGVRFGEPEIDLDTLRDYKDGVVGKLTGGLAGMAKKRKVEVVHGVGQLSGSHELAVETPDGERQITFANIIVAVGSQSVELPFIPHDDPRVLDSTSALELEDIPGRLLVIGGGIIGLEMACVYSALGSEVTVVELLPQLMTGADPDLVRPLQKRINGMYKAIYLETKVTGVEATDAGLVAHFEGAKAPESETYDRVLVAVGRSPNGLKISADKAGLAVSDRGFIDVDTQMRTNVSHIFAIGDVVGQPMLAHKATHEGKVAAEVCAGEKSAFDARVIPSVAYTDPEVAWVGVTETEAKKAGHDYGVGKFPWAASGRALGIDRPEGFSKLIFDKATDRIIGAGIVGPHAGDLISECALAIEMGCEVSDIGLTIHPHPTLSETVGLAAEVFEGTVTDLYIPKR